MRVTDNTINTDCMSPEMRRLFAAHVLTILPDDSTSLFRHSRYFVSARDSLSTGKRREKRRAISIDVSMAVLDVKRSKMRAVHENTCREAMRQSANQRAAYPSQMIGCRFTIR